MARRLRQPAPPEVAALAIAACLTSPTLAIDRLVLSVERIEAAGTSLTDTQLDLALDPRTALPSGQLSIGASPVGGLGMHLALQEEGRGGLRFSAERLRFAGGLINLEAALEGRKWSFGVSGKGVSGEALLGLGRRFLTVPKDIAVQGSLDAALRVVGRTDSQLPSEASLVMRGRGLGFTNEEGNFAAEGIDIGAGLTLRNSTGDAFVFEGRIDSSSGEALFDNTYLKLGTYPTSLSLEGTLSGTRLELAALELRQLGLLHVSANATLSQAKHYLDAPLDLESLRVEQAMVSLHELRFPAVYTSYMQTALAGSALDSLESSGNISGTLTIRDNQPIEGNLTLDDLSLRDTKGLFFIDRLRGQLSWVPDGEEPLEPSTLAWDSAGTYDVSGAGASTRLVLRGQSISLLEPVRLPVFDGAINVRELRVRNAGQPSMQVQFNGEIEPISLSEISKAFGWPELGGFITGRIPSVEYKEDTLSFGGDLEAEIFDGLIRGSNIKLIDPLGRWPRLTADLALENLDLETITSTLEFGTITGRIEGRVDHLELFAWSPVSFDAFLRTPSSDHGRKLISIDAINSIANVGGTAGTGVANALRGGVMRFFSRYRYRQLAVRCTLEDDICQLSGAPIAGNRYYILEGAGVPRVNIIGNSGRVQWSELLDQIAWQIQTGGTFRVE